MSDRFYIDISCKQQNCKREKVCGDTFLFKRSPDGTRYVIVLSDGMGHGVKANILSNITAGMIVHFNYEKLNIEKLTRTILKSLPVCSIRKVSYSTFSIIDIDLVKSVATIIEYDNPKRLIFRGKKRLLTIEEIFAIKSPTRNQVISTTRFRIEEGDRIVLMSDGVSQSGMGTKYRFGWGRDNVEKYVLDKINEDEQIASATIATDVVWESICNDSGITNDDVSCAVITIRKPKRILLCSAIPLKGIEDSYIDMLSEFDGMRIICGYELANLVAAKWERTIEKSNTSTNPEIEPIWRLRGVDLVTESLLTLNRVYDLLEDRDIYRNPESNAYKIMDALLKSDEIDIVIGKNRQKGWVYKVNDYDLRHNILILIIESLEKRHCKEVNVIYV